MEKQAKQWSAQQEWGDFRNHLQTRGTLDKKRNNENTACGNTTNVETCGRISQNKP